LPPFSAPFAVGVAIGVVVYGNNFYGIRLRRSDSHAQRNQPNGNSRTDNKSS
jgi:hypothetical protein